MQQFKTQVIEHITTVLKIYQPYQSRLTESERQDLIDLKACKQILIRRNNIIQKTKKYKKVMVDTNLMLGLILGFV